MPRFGLRSADAPAVCALCGALVYRLLALPAWWCSRCSSPPEELRAQAEIQPETGLQIEPEMFVFAGFAMFEPKAPGVIATTYRRLAGWWTGRVAT